MLSTLFSIFIFIVVLSVLVLVHEWGHFIMCRRNGVRVEEFSLGLPPRAKVLWKDKHGTLFSLGYVPFGGFVRPYGEDSADASVLKASDSFSAKSIWVRTKILLAGIGMNFILAFVLFYGLFLVGMQPFVLPGTSDFEYYRSLGVLEAHSNGVLVEELAEEPALSSGLLGGDYIIRFNDEEVSSGEDLIALSRAHAGEQVEYTVRRGEEELLVSLTLSDSGRAGISIRDDIQVDALHDVRYGPYEALIWSFYETGRIAWLTMKAFVGVFRQFLSGGGVPDEISGPLGIAFMTGDVAQDGFRALLRFVAFLSVSLGAINVLPIPALDGGRFLFVFFEVLRGKPANALWEGRIHALGFLILIALILVVTYKDVLRFVAE